MNPLFVHIGAFRFAISNLRRRYLRSLAVGVPLTVAMTLAVTATLISDGIREDGKLAAAQSPDLVIQKVVAGELAPIHLPSIREVLAARVNDTEMAERVWGLVAAPGEQAEGALATVFGIAWGDRRSVPGSAVLGRWPDADEQGVAIVGPGISAMGNTDVDKTIRLSHKGNITLKIVGMIEPNASVAAASSIWAHPNDVRQLLGLEPDEATDVVVTLNDDRDLAYLAETVVLKLPQHRLVEKKTVFRLFEIIYGERSADFMLIWMILILVVVFLTFALGMDIAAHERREMAVLKAVGWPTLLVIETRVFEAVILGLGATVTGLGLGGLWAIIGAPVLRDYFIGWGAVYPAFALPLAMEWSTALLLVALGTIPLMAASVIPAWRVGILAPDEALRG